MTHGQRFGLYFLMNSSFSQLMETCKGIQETSKANAISAFKGELMNNYGFMIADFRADDVGKPDFSGWVVSKQVGGQTVYSILPNESQLAAALLPGYGSGNCPKRGDEKTILNSMHDLTLSVPTLGTPHLDVSRRRHGGLYEERRTRRARP